MIEPAPDSVSRLQLIRDRAEARGQVSEQPEGPPAVKPAELLKLMRARGLRLTAAQRDRVLSCTDPALLAKWSKRAATLGSVAQILAK